MQSWAIQFAFPEGVGDDTAFAATAKRCSEMQAESMAAVRQQLDAAMDLFTKARLEHVAEKEAAAVAGAAAAREAASQPAASDAVQAPDVMDVDKQARDEDFIKEAMERLSSMDGLGDSSALKRELEANLTEAMLHGFKKARTGRP